MKYIANYPTGGAGGGAAIQGSGTYTQNTGTVQFSNSNGVTFGLSANGVMTASVAAAGGAQTGISGLSAGTTQMTSGTAVFSNSNGISFGVDGNTITASYNSTQFLTTAAQSNQVVNSINGSTGTFSFNTGSSLSSSRVGNAITFGLASNITTALQSTGAYLTTARASNDAVGLNTALTAGPLAWTVNSSGISLNAGSAAGTTSGFGGNLISGSMTHNTAGLNLSLNHPVWLTTAMQSNAATISNIRVSGGTTSNLLSAITFADSNGVSFGLNAGTMTATVKTDYLTSQSNQAVSANNGSYAFQTLSFSNANGVSFGTSAGSAITASHNGLTTARASNDAIGLNTAQSNVTWTVNSSGLSFDARGYAGTNTGFTGTNISATMTLNSNGLSLRLSGGGGAGGAALKGSGTYTQNTGTVEFANSNGITFGLSNNGTMTASHNGITSQTNQTVGLYALGNTTQNSSSTMDARTMSYNALGAMTMGFSNGSIQVSAPASSSLVGVGAITISTAGSTISISGGTVAAAPVNFSAGTTSGNIGSIVFSNSNRVSFGLNGSTITAQHALNFSGGTTSQNVSDQIVFSNSNGISFGLNGSTMTASVATSLTNIKISGGTLSNNLSELVFSNSNGVSFGLSGSTITGSVAPAGRTLSTFVPYLLGNSATLTIHGQGATSGSVRFVPMFVSENVQFNAVRVLLNLSYVTSSVSGQQSVTLSYGLYSNNAGSLSSISTNSFSLGVTNSSVSNTVSYPVSTGTDGYTYTTQTQSTTANIQSAWGTGAPRVVDLAFTNSMSLASGQYWLGLIVRNSSSSANIGIHLGVVGMSINPVNNIAIFGVASSAQTTNSAYRIPYHGLGVYTVSQSSLPNNVPLTQIAQTMTLVPAYTILST